jgi:hypothetical protein
MTVQYGITQVHGYAFPGAHLTGQLDFFHLRTTLDIIPNGIVAPFVDDFGNTLPVDEQPVLPYTDINGVVYTTESQYNAGLAVQQRFNDLVYLVCMKAQPVITGTPTSDTETAPVADLPVTNTLTPGASVTVYEFHWAVEHTQAQDPLELVFALNGIDGFVATTTPNTTNVAITVTSSYPIP